MSKQKAKGTAAETALARYLRAEWDVPALRPSMQGRGDLGDVVDRWPPNVVFEVKSYAGSASAGQPGDAQLRQWHGELETEMANAGVPRGVLVVKRAGVGMSGVGRWWAYVPLTLLGLRSAGEARGRDALACVTVQAACAWLWPDGRGTN